MNLEHDDGRPAVSPMRSRVSTGYAKLDEALHGGFLEGSAIILTSPPSGEVPIIVRNYLGSSGEPSLLICRSLTAAEIVLQPGDTELKCLICSGKPVPSSKNMLPGSGIENLTELNLKIAETIDLLQPRKIGLEILPDILLQHKALQTRKWLNEFLEKLRIRNITTLAILNPYMHSSEEVQAVVDIFDGELELIEKDIDGKPSKHMHVKWMHGVEIDENDLPLHLAPEPSPETQQESASPERPEEGKITELGRKLDTIMGRLDVIEQVISDSLEHPELSSTISNLRAGVLLVKEPIAALERLNSARKYIHERAVEKDEISRLIIQTLALKGPQNISQIERAVRESRGSASRRIIRSRIETLLNQGILHTGEGHGAVYELTK